MEFCAEPAMQVPFELGMSEPSTIKVVEFWRVRSSTMHVEGSTLESKFSVSCSGGFRLRSKDVNLGGFCAVQMFEQIQS